MNKNIGLICMMMATACSGETQFIPCPPLPESAGLSALYATGLETGLIIAGGANFADKPLTEGGRKKFHDRICRLDEAGWQTIGQLPEPSAYGACFRLDGKLVIAGGANATGPLQTVCTVDPDGEVERLADLPFPVEQGTACTGDGNAYLLGGLSDGRPVAEVLRYAENRWEVFCPLPEPMVQPVALVSEDRLYVWGGLNPVKREALDYGYVYSGGCWTRIPGWKTGETFVGAASAVMDGKLYVAGGVDKSLFDTAVTLSGEALRQYLRQDVSYYRFRSGLHVFDPDSGTWSTAGSHPGLARAGAALIAGRDGNLYQVGGETKPGVRTAEVWKITMK